MRSLGNRRAALITGAATVAMIALAGCSAGQVAETALLDAPISGLNATTADGGLAIRNLQVLYNNPGGYPAGSSAPLEVSLINQTQRPLTVLISSRPADSGRTDIVYARQVGLVGGTLPTPSGAAPEPSGSRPAATPITDPSSSVEQPSAEPSALPTGSAAPAAAAQPARITIAPLGSATFLPGDRPALQVIGLSGKLAPGQSVNLVFETSTGSQPLVVQAPVAIPLSPASRAPGIPPHQNLGHE